MQVWSRIVHWSEEEKKGVVMEEPLTRKDPAQCPGADGTVCRAAGGRHLAPRGTPSLPAPLSAGRGCKAGGCKGALSDRAG